MMHLLVAGRSVFYSPVLVGSIYYPCEESNPDWLDGQAIAPDSASGCNGSGMEKAI
jgi:hypothetical protein